jgi:hypothetical protein
MSMLEVLLTLTQTPTLIKINISAGTDSNVGRSLHTGNIGLFYTLMIKTFFCVTQQIFMLLFASLVMYVMGL